MIKKRTIKLFGVAGGGKTTYCLKLIKEFLEQGYKMEDICFTTFTKSGIRSIKDKLKKDGIDFVEKNCNFRTLNSLTWRLCNYSATEEVTKKEAREFFKSVGLVVEEEEGENEKLPYEHVMDIYSNLLNTKGKVIDEISSDERVDYVNNYINNHDLDASSRNFYLSNLLKYDEWKKKENKKVYVDSIIDTIKNKIDIPNNILIVDEAQDLSFSQTLLVDLWTKHYDRDIFVIAGDDDQTVHEWAGAKPEYLVNYVNDNVEEVILNKSYRLPANVGDFCNSVLRQIDFRKEKWITSENKKGLINDIAFVDRGDFADWFLKNFRYQKCFLLFRTKRQLDTTAYALFHHPLSVPFGYIKSSGVYWSPKLICVSNALNKIQNKKDLLVVEVKKLMDTLPSSLCLVRGAKSKYSERSDNSVVPFGEFLGLTKLWAPQRTLGSDFVEKTNLKSDVLRYMNYTGGTFDTQRKLQKEQDIKRKLEGISELFKLGFDDDGELYINMGIKLGTFHSSKGLEEENVFVFLGTNKYFNNINDSEKRVLYVACSRCLRNMFFIRPFEGEMGSLDDFVSFVKLVRISKGS